MRLFFSATIVQPNLFVKCLLLSSICLDRQRPKIGAGGESPILTADNFKNKKTFLAAFYHLTNSSR
jgi:hypothetical protein